VGTLAGVDDTAVGEAGVWTGNAMAVSLDALLGGGVAVAGGAGATVADGVGGITVVAFVFS
jgi:hypothetical protein